MMKKNILIVTHSNDNKAVDVVSEHIREKGFIPFRFNTDQYPTHFHLNSEFRSDGYSYYLTAPDGNCISQDEILSVWYRRFYPANSIDIEMDSQLRSICIDESMNTLLGYLTNIDCFKLDDYWTVRKAANKEYQLKIAHRLGLNIPHTLITNHPPTVKAFYDSNQKNIIAKMQSQFSIWKKNQEQVLFTSIITSDHLLNMNGLDQCPMTFQSNIRKKLELRATVVDENVFCAAIDSNAHSNMSIDWRKRGLDTLEYWFKYQLPEYIEHQLIMLTKTLGLKYGAIDLILSPEDHYIFLEINPSGEFYWMDEYTHLNICEAISNQLTLMH